ncbi:hypothetical protein [Bacillus thuringiensis]|uniref:hypothetical protein n=1 Tax=Bacillus thuringiensis TaxID=1428 RepID=UPI0005CE24BF|nr:hypothetical protein [Bacillus thuringiensis]
MLAERKRMIITGQSAIDMVEETVNKEYTESQLHLFQNIANRRAKRKIRKFFWEESKINAYESR